MSKEREEKPVFFLCAYNGKTSLSKNGYWKSMDMGPFAATRLIMSYKQYVQVGIFWKGMSFTPILQEMHKGSQFCNRLLSIIEDLKSRVYIVHLGCVGGKFEEGGRVRGAGLFFTF